LTICTFYVLTGRTSRKSEKFYPAELSADFSLGELNTALLTIKPGKAAGFDGVYPEFIKNSGTRKNSLLFQRYFEDG
jgi:hypothetical protein